MAFLKETDIISGREGQVFATINGRQVELAEVRSLEATISKNKVAFKVLGFRGTQNKATGFDGTGTMTMYYNTTMWAEIMHDYTANGVDLYFSIVVVNSDPSSSIGTQRVRLNGCNLDDLIIAKIDTESEFLDTSLAFTFADYDILDSFGRVLA